MTSAALPLFEHVQRNVNSLRRRPVSLLHRDEPELLGRLRGGSLHGTLSSVRVGKAALGREQLRRLFGRRYLTRLSGVDLTSVALVRWRGVVGGGNFLVLLADQVFVTAFIRRRDCRFLDLFWVNPVGEDFRWAVDLLERVQSL